MSQIPYAPKAAIYHAWWNILTKSIESLRLEKTARVVYSNHQPIPIMPTNTQPSVPHLLFSQRSPAPRPGKARRYQTSVVDDNEAMSYGSKEMPE